MQLNPEQLLAAQQPNVPVLVLAGPGTGKTTALVGRFVHLINSGVDANSILCCTFAKKAADELSQRIQLETGIKTRGLPIGTFHSLALRLLKSDGRSIGLEPPSQVLMEKDRLKAIFDIKKSVNAVDIYKDLDKESSRPSNILKYIDEVREQLLDPEDASVEASEGGNLVHIAHAEIYSHYDEWLTQNGKIDFPRMIQWACKLLISDAANGSPIASKYKHILVDEYQDINMAQKTMVDNLLAGGGNQWAVGDDDQAIYGWRGSSLKFILNFEQSYPGTQKVNLVRNYRSGKTIVANATDLIKNVRRRYPKELVSESTKTAEVKLVGCKDENDEALRVFRAVAERIKAGISPDNIAVLSRTNTLPATVIDELIKHEIPVVLKDGVQLFSDPVAQELISAVAIAAQVQPEKGWDRWLPKNFKSFAEKISDDKWSTKVKALATLMVKNSPAELPEEDLAARVVSIDHYKDYLLGFDGPQEVFSRIRRSMQQPKDKKGVHIGTIHSAKGLEWDSVIVIGWEDDVLPHGFNHSYKGIDEERRLAYVAVTRAKDFLMLSFAEKRHGHEKEYSRFLDEMPLANDGVKLKPKVKKTKQDTKKASNDPIAKISKKYEAEIRKFEAEVASGKGQVKLPSTKSEQISTRSSKPSIAESKNTETDQDFYKEVNAILMKKTLSKNVADGSGVGTQGIIDAGDGFLIDAGYSVKKDGPGSATRKKILSEVFEGKVDLPFDIKESVAEQWGSPNSFERLQKMRNSINFSLGTQKGRKNPSQQAIRKWEEDLSYIDNILSKDV